MRDVSDTLIRQFCISFSFSQSFFNESFVLPPRGAFFFCFSMMIVLYTRIRTLLLSLGDHWTRLGHSYRQDYDLVRRCMTTSHLDVAFRILKVY